MVRMRLSPAHTDCDGAKVGRDAVVGAVEIAELGVEFDVGANPAGYSAAEDVSELVQALGEEVSVQRQTAVEAPVPPGKERAASRSRNSGRGVQLAGAMEKGRPDQNISTPQLGHRNVNDRIDG